MLCMMSCCLCLATHCHSGDALLGGFLLFSYCKRHFENRIPSLRVPPNPRRGLWVCLWGVGEWQVVADSRGTSAYPSAYGVAGECWVEGAGGCWRLLEVVGRECGLPGKLQALGFQRGLSAPRLFAGLMEKIPVRRRGGIWSWIKKGLGDRTAGVRTDSRLQALCMLFFRVGFR